MQENSTSMGMSHQKWGWVWFPGTIYVKGNVEQPLGNVIEVVSDDADFQEVSIYNRYPVQRNRERCSY